MERNWLTIVNKADESAEIHIEGTIGSYWKDNQEAVLRKEEMQQQLKQIAELKVKNIVVHINSYGGDVNHGVSIHDLLANHEAKVTTIVNGHTASAATIIAQAGDVRKMSSNALILIHNASTISWGDKNDMKVAIQDLEKVDETLANIYAKRTGKTKEEMLEKMNSNNGRGEWLTADEAEELGLIDEQYEPMKAAASIDKDILLRFGLPEIPANKLNINKTKNEVPMKMKVLAAWAAIIAFFAFDTTKENELNEADLQKLNDHLTDQNTKIANFESQLATANDSLNAEKTAHQATTESLTAANAQITELTAEITTLKATAGASAAVAKPEGDVENEGEKVETAAKGENFMDDLAAIKESYANVIR